MEFDTVMFLVALSLPVWLVAEQVNSWRRRSKSPPGVCRVPDHSRPRLLGGDAEYSPRAAGSSAQGRLRVLRVSPAAGEDQNGIGRDHDLGRGRRWREQQRLPDAQER